MKKFIDKLVYLMTDKPEGYKPVKKPPKTFFDKLFRPDDARQVQYNRWLKHVEQKYKYRPVSPSTPKPKLRQKVATRSPMLLQTERLPLKQKQKAPEKKFFFNRFRKGTREYELVQELKRRKEKFKEEDILFITRVPTREILWLEKGSSTAGFEHIKQRHTQDFLKKFGVKQNKIPSFLKKVVEEGTIVSESSRIQGDREQIKRIYLYQNQYHVITALGTNGFIVSAYPRKEIKNGKN